MKFETKAIHHGLDANSNYGETVMPIFQSAAFSYEDAESLENVFEGRRFGHVYSRISNPTVTSLEQRICSLENARAAVAFNSGMAALHALCLAFVGPGESFVSSTSFSIASTLS